MHQDLSFFSLYSYALYAASAEIPSFIVLKIPAEPFRRHKRGGSVEKIMPRETHTNSAILCLGYTEYKLTQGSSRRSVRSSSCFACDRRGCQEPSYPVNSRSLDHARECMPGRGPLTACRIGQKLHPSLRVPCAEQRSRTQASLRGSEAHDRANGMKPRPKLGKVAICAEPSTTFT